MNEAHKEFIPYMRAAESWARERIGRNVDPARGYLDFSVDQIGVGANLRSMQLLQQIANSLDEIAKWAPLTDEEKHAAREAQEKKRKNELQKHLDYLRYKDRRKRFAIAYTAELFRHLERKHGAEVVQTLRASRGWFACWSAKERKIWFGRLDGSRREKRERIRKTKMKLREDIAAFQFTDIMDWHGVGKVKLKTFAEKLAAHWDEAAQYLKDN